MEITVCIGSSCHLKGSREVVKQLESLIEEYHLKDKIELNGSFCMGECVEGVCTKINNQIYSLSPGTTRDFFEAHVIGGLER